MGELRESCPCGSLNLIWGIESYMGHFFQIFLWPVILLHSPGPESVFGLTQDPPLYACISWAKWILVKRPAGRLASLPFWPFCTCVVGKVSLTLRRRSMWFFVSAVPPPFHLEVSVHRGQTLAAAQPGAHLSLASSWNTVQEMLPWRMSPVLILKSGTGKSG